MNFNPVWWGLWLPTPNTTSYPQRFFLLPACESSHELQASKETEPQEPTNDDRVSSKRRTWTPEEDELLMKVIHELQEKTHQFKVPYRLIAKNFSGRTSKQIRERYLNKLDPRINSDPFTLEEDEQISQFYLRQGPRWKDLSLKMKGRTTTMIKNRFNTKLRSLILSRKKRRAANPIAQRPSFIQDK